MRDSKLVEQEFGERLLARRVDRAVVVGFLVQAFEIGRGDLEGVEHEGGALGVHGLVGEGTHDLQDGDLQAHGVFDEADGLIGALGVSSFMEDAKLAVAAGGRRTG